MVVLIKTLRCRILEPNTGKRESFEQTRHATGMAASIVDRAIRSVGPDDTALHHATYFDIRKRTGLSSRTIQALRIKIVGAWRSYRKKKRNGDENAREPDFNRQLFTIPLGAGNVKLVKKAENRHPFIASIITLNGRIHSPLEVGSKDAETIDGILNGGLELGKCELIKKRNGEWWLHMAVRQEMEIPEPDETFTPVGVDLGLVNLAVVSTADGKINRFFNGKRAGWMRDHYFKRRRRLGMARKPDAIRKSRNAEHRWMTDLNHKIASQIVGEASKLSRPVIVLEDLKYIRSDLKAHGKQRRGLHSWAFGQLQQFIGYKAGLAGIPVVYVDPGNTSRTCPVCGHAGTRNLKKRRFHCGNCGISLNDDLAAARNIALRFRASRCGTERAVGLRPSGSRIVLDRLQIPGRRHVA